MANFKDWSWRPDFLTLEAIRRGATKITQASYHAREDIINFNRESVRRQLTRKGGGHAEYDQLEIRAYLARISTNVSLVRGNYYASVETGRADDRKAGTHVPGSRRGVPGVGSARPHGGVGAASRGGGQGNARDKVRGSRVRTNVGKTGARAPRRSRIMSWATIVLNRMGETRALGRFTGDDAVDVAKLEVQALPEGMRDVTIVKPGHDLRPMNNAELDALMRQFGDGRVGLKKEVKMQAVMHYLALFEFTRHDDNGALTGEAYPPAPVETEVTEETDTAGDGTKKKGGKAKAKAKGKAVKGKTAKAKSNGAAKGDGLGREGTPARFIRELLAKGTDPEKIATAGAKKFPSNPITVTYVKWYANDMKKKGLLKA